MKLLPSSVLLAVLLVAAVPASANLKLATSKMCMGCHAVDKKVVGPAFKEVAAKYAKQKGALPQLVERVMKGSGSKLNWGTMPMPANPQVSKAEAELLVKWVLSQK
jgi:cytochrome c